MAHQYRVEQKGPDTTIRKARWYEPGRQSFEVAKSYALRYLKFHRDSYNDGIKELSEMYPCANCGAITSLKYGPDKYACEKHGGKEPGG